MAMVVAASIISFIFGGIAGAVIGLFMTGVGKNNTEHEYYHEGFIDGYNKAKEEEE